MHKYLKLKFTRDGKVKKTKTKEYAIVGNEEKHLIDG